MPSTDLHEPTPDAPDDPDALPRHTTPTWEVELLISGVAVFAMLQLPGWLDDRVLMLRPRFDADWASVVLVIGMYLKGATVILAATFALHLLLRAQWIALVGMHSVFPAGIRWDRLRMGPIQREVERRRHGSTAASIDRADNRATVLFAIGVMLATLLLLISVLAAVGLTVGVAIMHLSGGHTDATNVLLGFMLLLLGPLLLANLVDRRFGARIQTGGRWRKMLDGLFRFYGRTGLGRGSDVLAMLTSHGGQLRMTALIATVFGVVLFGSAVGVLALRDPAAIGNYSLFPYTSEDSGRRVDAAHYDDQRDLLHDEAVTFVQSAVVHGPYLKLVVPYQPARDNAALRDHCAIALAVPDHDARALATLQCLALRHPLSLDGKPLTDVRWDAGDDDRTNRPALRTMIDIRALPPGRHELRIGRSPRPNREADDAVSVIAFWN